MTQKKSKKTSISSIKPAQLKTLKAEAEKARKKAYAPYSGFKVGAALLTPDGKIFSGCNVENASYGGTICAERTAILKAISEGASTPIQAIHVVSSALDPWPPCGMCLQVMAEFCAPSTVVMISGQKSPGKNQEKLFRLSDLLPESFDPHYLRKS
jgi:cytidine deaminase